MVLRSCRTVAKAGAASLPAAVHSFVATAVGATVAAAGAACSPAAIHGFVATAVGTTISAAGAASLPAPPAPDDA